MGNLITQRAASKRYYDKNKKLISERQRKYHGTEEFKAWREENRDKYREKENALAREYYHRNKDAISVKMKALRKQLRDDIFKLLGDRCSSCGFDDIRALQIDHVNGGGNRMRKDLGDVKHTKSILCSIIEGSTDYQILCANCNWIKRHTNKEIQTNEKLTTSEN